MPHVVECGSQDTIFDTVVVATSFWMFLKVARETLHTKCLWMDGCLRYQTLH